MEKSATISNLAVALVNLQGELKPAIFNAKNPFLKNKYADLSAVVEASRPLLQKYGLAITQFPTDSSDWGASKSFVGVTTLLIHESGEFIQESCVIPVEDEKGVNLSQVAGKNITYLRRYAWAAVLGMVSEEDMDGEVYGENKKDVKPVEQKRQWSAEQTEAVSLYNLDEFGEPVEKGEAARLLDMSVLPITATPATIKSWYKHLVTAGKDTELESASLANEAYMKAKKGSK